MDRILLIEDDAGAQLLFKNRLEDLGHEVVVAATGAMGLMEARASAFDLFLVDIGLGSGINGYEVCQRLKAMPMLHSVPVVLISGQVKGQEELHRGYEAGCESFLVKGDLTLLEDVVRAMLRLKSLQDDLGMQNRLLEEQNRRLFEERQRGAELETALRETGSRAHVFHELAAGRPDGVLVVDAEGIVRYADRGARDVLGKGLEGQHLASLVPGVGLEAYVRNARTEPHEAFRFDRTNREGRVVRSLMASVLPLVPRPNAEEGPMKVVLLGDAQKRKVAAEMLRLEEHGLPRRELGPLLEAARSVFNPEQILGQSKLIGELRENVAKAAEGTEPVLLIGESGTGKRFIARILHFSGLRRGAFVPLDCGAISPALLEIELFGQARGASPEAIYDRPGILQQAYTGTVFLEEITEIPLAVQERLHRALEEGHAMRVGGNTTEPVDVRVMASTTRDIERFVEERRFHRGLWNLLRATLIRTPPLRKCTGDPAHIAEHFLKRFAGERQLRFSPEARWILDQHMWSGNVCELEESIGTACAEASSEEIQVPDLPQPLSDLFRRLKDEIPPALPHSEPASVYVSNGELGDDEEVSLQAFERKALLTALQRTQGDKLAAASLLKIGKSTFYRKLKAHDIH